MDLECFENTTFRMSMKIFPEKCIRIWKWHQHLSLRTGLSIKQNMSWSPASLSASWLCKWCDQVPLDPVTKSSHIISYVSSKWVQTNPFFLELFLSQQWEFKLIYYFSRWLYVVRQKIWDSLIYFTFVYFSYCFIFLEISGCRPC